MKRAITSLAFLVSIILWYVLIHPPRPFSKDEFIDAPTYSLDYICANVDLLENQLIRLDVTVENGFSTNLTGGLYRITDKSGYAVWVMSNQLNPKRKAISLYACIRNLGRLGNTTFIVLTELKYRYLTDKPELKDVTDNNIREPSLIIQTHSEFQTKTY